MTVQQLSGVLGFLTSSGPAARGLTTALFLGFHTLLRQGNLLASNSSFDPGHTLSANDVVAMTQGLVVTVRWTNTR